MLFNSYFFVFTFLPVSLIGYQLLSRFGRSALLGWLSFISICFYGYWNPKYLVLLLGSMSMNYLFSQTLGPDKPEKHQNQWLTAAIAANLLLLIYYKYLFPVLNFLHVHHAAPRSFSNVLLPLGISFFTFTQIAYLVDLRQSVASRQSLLPYSVFVTFFPHLIAGPVIRPGEVMPQLEKRLLGLRIDDMSTGMTWFVLGLCKKVLIADRLAPMADNLFAQPRFAGPGASWLGAVAYALQLYFDFSGYSDMALGLARMFSIDFPINFNSPFRSSSIIEFWHRWHMTLSRYLNRYLYAPILTDAVTRRANAGKKISRKASSTVPGFLHMVAYPTMTTMFLAGIWHGAGLQFVIFGLLQGFFLALNRLWRLLTPRGTRLHDVIPTPVSVALTLTCWLFTLVFFRASSVHEAVYIVGTMFGAHHAAPGPLLGGTAPLPVLALLVLAAIISYAAPSVWEIKPRPQLRYACGLACLLTLAVLSLEKESPFLYFQF